MKVQTHSLSETSLEYNQDQAPLMNQGWLWTFTQLGSYTIIMQFPMSSKKESR